MTVKKSRGTGNKVFVKKPFYDFVKRVFDFICSLIAIILFSPFFLIIAAAIKADSPGPVIFSHKRVGKNGREIGIYKFRSMVQNAEQLKEKFTPEQKAEFELNYKLDNDPRITRVGKFLRKTSLDEIPQLFNILRGELSIVGPRPVLEVETEKFGAYRDLLLSVKPGLTGFWAANGRSCTSYRRRMAMEIYYVKNRSVILDLKIIFKTVLSVFTGRGAK